MTSVISQGSVATRLRCGGQCDSHFVANFLLNSTMEKFRKSVNICQSYGQKYRGPFLTHGVVVCTQMYLTGRHSPIVGVVNAKLVKQFLQWRYFRLDLVAVGVFTAVNSHTIAYDFGIQYFIDIIIHHELAAAATNCITYGIRFKRLFGHIL